MWKMPSVYSLWVPNHQSSVWPQLVLFSMSGFSPKSDQDGSRCSCLAQISKVSWVFPNADKFEGVNLQDIPVIACLNGIIISRDTYLSTLKLQNWNSPLDFTQLKNVFETPDFLQKLFQNTAYKLVWEEKPVPISVRSNVPGSLKGHHFGIIYGIQLYTVLYFVIVLCIHRRNNLADHCTSSCFHQTCIKYVA